MKKALMIIILVGLSGCDKTEEPKLSSNPHNDEQVIQNINSNWQYDLTKDEMRGIEKKFASTTSTNQVNFNFPYEGGSSLQLIIRQHDNNEPEIIFSINKGQFLCAIDNCEVSYKFDDNLVDSSKLSLPTDHSSNLLFIENGRDARAFIYMLQKSEKLIVELPFYQSGNKQFSFNIKGFKWNQDKEIDNINTTTESDSMIDAAVLNERV